MKESERREELQREGKMEENQEVGQINLHRRRNLWGFGAEAPPILYLKTTLFTYLPVFLQHCTSDR